MTSYGTRTSTPLVLFGCNYSKMGCTNGNANTFWREKKGERRKGLWFNLLCMQKVPHSTVHP